MCSNPAGPLYLWMYYAISYTGPEHPQSLVWDGDGELSWNQSLQILRDNYIHKYYLPLGRGTGGRNRLRRKTSHCLLVYYF